MIKRKSEAIWIDKLNSWSVKVQKNGVRKSFYSGTKGRKGKHEAEYKADQWLQNDTEDMSFDAAWKLFIADQEKKTSESNVKKHKQYHKLYIDPQISRRKLSTITPLLWQSCIDAGASKGLSRRSCENIRATITCFMKYAYRARWDVQRIEDGDLTIPRSAVPKKEKQVLQPESIRMLFSDPYITRYGKKVLSAYSYAFQFFVVTGLRRGELAGLRKEDVQTKDGITTITISRSINTIGQETAGKNDNARRTIELSKAAVEVLEKQKAYLRELSIISPWVFPDTYGERPDPNAIYEHWRTWREQHNVSVSIHELRHTFVSINKADLPLELMKATVGHSTSMDTYGIYGHDVDGERHRAAEIVSGVFDKILSDPQK